MCILFQLHHFSHVWLSFSLSPCFCLWIREVGRSCECVMQTQVWWILQWTWLSVWRVVFQQEVVCQAMGECSQILSFKAWDIETISVTGFMLGKGDSSECHANVPFRCHLTFLWLHGVQYIKWSSARPCWKVCSWLMSLSSFIFPTHAIVVDPQLWAVSNENVYCRVKYSYWV